jgi:hypothetical protein
MRAAITLAVLIGTAGAACAESGPVIAIPGRPGLPVIINGVDASYAVVEGDWGLAKGVHFQVTVYGGHPVEPGPPVGHYYPSAGHLPGYGRFEIESADKPKPAPTFRQSWSAGSRDADPLIPPGSLNPVPPYPPPVIVAPQFNEHRREHKRTFQQNSAVPQPNSAAPQQNVAPPHESSPAPQQNPPAPQPEVRTPEAPQPHP